MIIKGNTVGTTMPRANWDQTDPKKADYIKGKETVENAIKDAQNTANAANTAASNAKTTADNAQTTANDAKTAAKNASDNSLPKAGGEMTGSVAMGGNKVTGLGAPADNGDAANKEYVDSKHKVFSATVTVNDWVGDAAPYTQTIGIEGILETDRPHITPVYADDLETKLAQREAWNMVCEAESADGSITFTCFEDKPAVAIPVQIEVNR